MIKQVKHRMVGNKDFQDTKLSLPDSWEELVDQYEMELVEFNNPEKLCVYFLVENADIFCYTIQNHKNPHNLKDGFKETLEQLKVVHDEKVGFEESIDQLKDFLDAKDR